MLAADRVGFPFSGFGFSGCWLEAVHDWHFKTRNQSLKPGQSLDPASDGVHLFKPCRIKNIGGRDGRLSLEREAQFDGHLHGE